MKVELNVEEIRAAVIEKCVSEIMDGHDGSIASIVREKIRERIDDRVASCMNDKIDALLNDAMRETLNESIIPVNMWGEKVGEPTTIKAAIHERARSFWESKVNSKGVETIYGGKPRWEHLLGEELRGAFADAIKQDMVNIAGALKDAVRKDFYGAVDKGLNDIFKIKSKIRFNHLLNIDSHKVNMLFRFV